MPETISLPTLAILTGGLGTRMYPATQAVAKSMLPIAGEPFLAHQLRWAVSEGIEQVVLCCGHLGEQIQSFAGDGSQWGCAIRYSGDGTSPLGTGGALRRALPLLGERFLVIYGDSFLRVSLRGIWREFLESGMPGMMTVFPNQDRWDTSNVHFSDSQIVRYSKQQRTPHMRHIDYGLNCFRASAFERWPDDSRFDLAEVQESLVAAGQLAGCEVSERFYEIGSPAGYAELEARLRTEARA